MPRSGKLLTWKIAFSFLFLFLPLPINFTLRNSLKMMGNHRKIMRDGNSLLLQLSHGGRYNLKSIRNLFALLMRLRFNGKNRICIWRNPQTEELQLYGLHIAITFWSPFHFTRNHRSSRWGPLIKYLKVTSFKHLPWTV